MSDEIFTSPLSELSGETERRRQQRQPASLAAAVGRGRLIPRLSGHYPSLRPGGWYQVIGRNPEAIEPVASEGFMWIEVDGRLRRVWAGHFEVQLNPR